MGRAKAKSGQPGEGDDPAPASTMQQYEEALRKAGEGTYVLRLFVSGMTPRSRAAIEDIRALCEEHLKGRYELDIVDIYQQPALTRDEQVLAAPTLVKKLPLPLRKIIGGLSDPGRVLVALGVKTEADRDKDDE